MHITDDGSIPEKGRQTKKRSLDQTRDATPLRELNAKLDGHGDRNEEVNGQPLRKQTKGLRSSSQLENESKSGVCFICNQPAEASNVLHKVLTLQFHQSVCNLAEDLSDTNLQITRYVIHGTLCNQISCA